MAIHIRSISMPTRTHPTVNTVEEELHKLRASIEASTSSSPQTMSDALRGLGSVYCSISDLIQLRCNSSNATEKKYLEDELDGSIRVLDLCDIMKSSLAKMKEHIEDLQIALRRRDVAAIECKVNAFTRFQKTMGRDLKSSIKSIMSNGRRCISNDEVNCLTEVKEIAVLALQQVTSFLAMRSEKEKSSKWSFVAKAVSKRRVANEMDENSVLDFISLNVTLRSICDKNVDDERVQMVKNQLQVFEVIVKDIEDGLEFLFRQLIQSRVALLNVLCL